MVGLNQKDHPIIFLACLEIVERPVKDNGDFNTFSQSNHSN